MGVIIVTVKCLRGADLIASYEFGYGITIGPSSPPTDECLMDGAKTNLTNEGIAFPPYEGVTFKILR